MVEEPRSAGGVGHGVVGERSAASIGWMSPGTEEGVDHGGAGDESVVALSDRECEWLVHHGAPVLLGSGSEGLSARLAAGSGVVNGIAMVLVAAGALQGVLVIGRGSGHRGTEPTHLRSAADGFADGCTSGTMRSDTVGAAAPVGAAGPVGVSAPVGAAGTLGAAGPVGAAGALGAAGMVGGAGAVGAAGAAEDPFATEASATLVAVASVGVRLARLEGHVAEQMDHDAVTGLPTLRLVARSVVGHVAAARRRGGSVGVLVVDVDDLRAINDQVGREGGNRLLRLLATRLGGVVRGADIVGHLGGDEFVVVLGQIDSAAGMELAARRVVQRLSEPVDLGGITVRVSVSVGAALTDRDDPDIDRALVRADAAKLRAKRAGPHHVAVDGGAVHDPLAPTSVWPVPMGPTRGS